MESMMELQQHMASAAEAQDGIVTLEGLEPGTYTLLRLATPNLQVSTPEEMYANMSVATAAVTIEEENQRLAISLAF